jgi:hypothetical protein
MKRNTFMAQVSLAVGLALVLMTTEARAQSQCLYLSAPTPATAYITVPRFLELISFTFVVQLVDGCGVLKDTVTFTWYGGEQGVTALTPRPVTVSAGTPVNVRFFVLVTRDAGANPYCDTFTIYGTSLLSGYATTSPVVCISP